mmetsp:Transcript_23209/g.39867  ORF Transcript_23209/g.39867 Transcript_23209/m.39867 type:complete len:247 (-) Transcript_23209:462-1202(-)
MVVGTLYIDITECEKLVKKGLIKKIKQAVCSISMPDTSNKFKTQPAAYSGDTKKAVWNAKTTFPVKADMATKLAVEVSESNDGKESLIGRCVLEFTALAEQEKMLEAWYPLLRSGSGNSRKERGRVRFTLRFQKEQKEPTIEVKSDESITASSPIENPEHNKIVDRAVTATGLVSAMDDEQKAALKIQAIYRGHHTRQSFKKDEVFNSAAASGSIPPAEEMEDHEDEEAAQRGFWASFFRSCRCMS